ncbi:NUDIX hydrolase [Pseudomonas sp. NPDC090208]|uniref:NUDIX hydrolase n=1 Tax=Pseudomonas sp. NPDC090208 TaxID=3364478 RepID=UPI0038278F35
MSDLRIRPLALCVFHHQGKILVNAFPDSVKQQTLFRPIGGGIEFGESSADTLVREVHEELRESISDLRLLGTLENIFTYLGKPHHEIVQIYDARFDNPAIYQQASVEGQESNGETFSARWLDSRAFSAESPLVPDGLEALLKSLSMLN